jgi:hypothetical protein
MLSEQIAKKLGLEFKLDDDGEVSSRITTYQYDALVDAFIEESMFAMMMSYEGKFNAILAKELLMEHFGIEE